MNFRYHEMPKDIFDALAAGRGGPTAIRALAKARYSKHLILLRGILAAAQGAGPEQARLARDGFDLLLAVQQHDPALARQVILHPSIGAWALRCVRQPRHDPAFTGPGPAAEPGWLSAAAAAAAIRAGLPAEIDVRPAGGVLLLPSLGQAELDAPTVSVRNGEDGAEISAGRCRVKVPDDPHRDAPGWLGLRGLRAGALDVLIDDLDPFRLPSSTSLAPRLGPAEATRLDAALQQAWRLLEAYHPATAAEIAAAVTVIVPLSNPRGGQVSSSSPATFGTVALSEPPDPCTGAVTLAHEIQHLKLSALIDLSPMILPEDGRGYYAPWRDDPRPLSGLLQGAYAFLGVATFWQRQRHLEVCHDDLRAHTEFARWRTAVTRTIETLLSSGRLTPAGLDFVQGMSRTADAWRDETVPAEAGLAARRQTESHLARWERDNGRPAGPS